MKRPPGFRRAEIPSAHAERSESQMMAPYEQKTPRLRCADVGIVVRFHHGHIIPCIANRCPPVDLPAKLSRVMPWSRLLVFAIAASLLLAFACGGDDNGNATPTQTRAASPS